MKPNVVSADALFEAFRGSLRWEWVAGLDASERRFDEVAVREAQSSADLVGYLYRELTFPTGCYLFTGTGIVPPDDFSLASGDEVRITIEPIGTLINAVL